MKEIHLPLLGVAAKIVERRSKPATARDVQIQSLSRRHRLGARNRNVSFGHSEFPSMDYSPESRHWRVCVGLGFAQPARPLACDARDLSERHAFSVYCLVLLTLSAGGRKLIGSGLGGEHFVLVLRRGWDGTRPASRLPLPPVTRPSQISRWPLVDVG